MARVKFDDVTKVFEDTSGPIVAVEELSLDIPDGEFVVFVGPSGCGKSTTLRMLAGLESITDGEIRLDDQPINQMSPRDRDIAMVFQSYALYPHKTVRQNMGYGLQLSTDLSDEEVDRRVVEAAEMMGIEDLLDKKPGSLSGGQQQRVATGRAIVREPAVFLFDEPLSNLDAQLRKHMRTELSRIHSELGITTIYVTHDQEEAMTMADRIVILNDGKLQQVGTPKEVYYRPANAFVADFIGSPSMNFFDVDLRTESDGSGTLAGEGISYAVSNDVVEMVGGDGEYTLGIRPENLRIDSTAPDAKTFEAEVDVVEVIGSDNFLYLEVGGKECRVRAPVEIEPAEGETVDVTFDESDLHLFDRNTEEALVHGHERADAEPRTIEQEA
ncbi:ABC transporter ATP-binding protein [Halogeometricum pallidum]|uniref:ABC transporter ATP-binding protein n=1 Tax=Halogeometricum pallidum TaxID=411361 RepID=UPI00067794B8|nr:sn-glycerol-3-phosphate ABC transporter ATP-binding protein UgpC [Halogeometricum pallidum]